MTTGEDISLEGLVVWNHNLAIKKQDSIVEAVLRAGITVVSRSSHDLLNRVVVLISFFNANDEVLGIVDSEYVANTCDCKRM